MRTKTEDSDDRERDRKAQGSAQWKRDERERMRAKGFMQVQVWVHQDDKGDVIGYAAKKRAKRGE